MNTTTSLSGSTTTAVVGALVLLGVLWMWRGSRKRTKNAAQAVTRTTGSLTRAFAAAGLIVVGQWFVITHYPSTTPVLVALAVPAVFAGIAFARMLPTTTHAVTTGRKGTRR